MTRKVVPLALACLMAAGVADMTSAADDVDYKGMTANVLKQLGGGAAEKPETGNAAESEQFIERISDIVKRARAEGRSNAYISDLVSEAARDSDVAVPRELLTATGEVDAATLLAIIVSRAETKEDAYAAALADEARGATAAAVTPAAVTTSGGEIVHVVAPGDSLAALAIKYYDDAQLYPRIMAANSDKIRRADLIMVGQRLIIPR